MNCVWLSIVHRTRPVAVNFKLGQLLNPTKCDRHYPAMTRKAVSVGLGRAPRLCGLVSGLSVLHRAGYHPLFWYFLDRTEVRSWLSQLFVFSDKQ